MSEINPPAAPGRTRGYDFARAVAIIGMVLINFPIFLMGSRGDVAGSFSYWLTELHYGRAAALFVTIAGAGIGLMARGANVWSVRRTLILRAIFLFTVGNFLILVWRIDILHFYAFYLFIAAIFFISLPRSFLLPLAIAIGLITVLLRAYDVDFDLIANWIASLSGSEAEIDLNDNYHSVSGMFENVFLNGIHPVFPWITYILVGMWASGLDLRDAPTRGRLMAVGGFMALGAPILSSLLETLALNGVISEAVLPFLGVRHSQSPFYLMGAWGTSFFVIGLAQAIVTRFGETLPIRAMISAGQLAFTIYLTHALLGVVIPSRFFGFGDLTHWQVIAYSFAFCFVVIVLAHIWRSFFDRGPLEWVMRGFAGNTPPKQTRPAPAAMAAPGFWVWPVLGVALVAVVGYQFVGPTLRVGCDTEARIEDRVVSALTLTCPRQSFAFNVDERSDVTLETHSGYDLYLEIYQGDEMVGQNDDGGEGLNARAITTLDAGEYRALIRPYDAAVGGFVFTRVDSEAREVADGEMCLNTCVYAGDGECDDGGAGSLYAVCGLGTDCMDCGVRRAEDFESLIGEDGMMCSDTCRTSSDGECDDGGPDSLYSICAYGSDCADCGPREPRLPSEVVPAATPIGEDGMMCTDTCGSSGDNECDDGGPDSLYSICTYGSDCSDCGPREPQE